MTVGELSPGCVVLTSFGLPHLRRHAPKLKMDPRVRSAVTLVGEYYDYFRRDCLGIVLGSFATGTATAMGVSLGLGLLRLRFHYCCDQLRSRREQRQ